MVPVVGRKCRGITAKHPACTLNPASDTARTRSATSGAYHGRGVRVQSFRLPVH